MENKYLQRAKEILEANGINVDSFDINGEDYGLKGKTNNLLIAMCQFGKEIEETLLNMSTKLLQAKYPNYKLYTIEEVEELLQKQRILCCLMCKLKKVDDSIVDKREENVYYLPNFRAVIIDKDTILNAKLKF